MKQKNSVDLYSDLVHDLKYYKRKRKQYGIKIKKIEKTLEYMGMPVPHESKIE